MYLKDWGIHKKVLFAHLLCGCVCGLVLSSALAVVFSVIRAASHSDDLKVFFLGTAAILWGVLGLALYLLYTFIERVLIVPIRRISYEAKQISLGLSTREIHMDSQDEIGWLAGSFNRMGRSLQLLSTEIKD